MTSIFFFQADILYTYNFAALSNLYCTAWKNVEKQHFDWFHGVFLQVKEDNGGDYAGMISIISIM